MTTTYAKYLAKQRTLRPRARRVITLDMDGTTYDPWACCGRRDDTYLGQPECPHHRADTITAVKEAAERLGAEVVVLSWRMGGSAHEATRRWLASTGINATSFYMPGSTDDVTTPEQVAQARRDFSYATHGQVAFKAATVRALQAQGVQVLEGWEDNGMVCDALRSLGVVMHQAPRLVQVSTADYRAGRIGGAKAWSSPREVGERPAKKVRETARSLFHEVHGVDKFWEV